MRYRIICSRLSISSVSIACLLRSLWFENTLGLRVGQTQMHRLELDQLFDECGDMLAYRPTPDAIGSRGLCFMFLFLHCIRTLLPALS